MAHSIRFASYWPWTGDRQRRRWRPDKSARIYIRDCEPITPQPPPPSRVIIEWSAKEMNKKNKNPPLSSLMIFIVSPNMEIRRRFEVSKWRETAAAGSMKKNQLIIVQPQGDHWGLKKSGEWRWWRLNLGDAKRNCLWPSDGFRDIIAKAAFFHSFLVRSLFRFFYTSHPATPGGLKVSSRSAAFREQTRNEWLKQMTRL